MKFFSNFINSILNVIFPNVCGICDSLCNEDLCKKCKLKLDDIAEIKIKEYKNKNFKKHLYIFKYEGIIKERLKVLKFNKKAYISKSFVYFIINNKKICSFLKYYDIIIPVPIHYNRKVDRGFNQSALIAKGIQKNVHTIRYMPNVLIKSKNNKPQSTKNKVDRELNVIGVYKIKNSKEIENKKVLLIDDIYTTGSTVNECAKILKENGAKLVDVITIAKD